MTPFEGQITTNDKKIKGKNGSKLFHQNNEDWQKYDYIEWE